MLYTIGNIFALINNKLVKKYVDPYNPLGLPANTIRVRTSDGQQPIKDTYTTYETATLVPGTNDVYDVYKSGTDFTRVLYSSTNVVEVLGANTSNVTDMTGMFNRCRNLTTVPLFDTSSVTNMTGMFLACRNLTTVPLFDTSNVTDMTSMFEGCSNLTTVPLFDTSSVISMNRMFRNCYSVESGALALYQQASTQANPPANHDSTFMQCGSNTQTGAAELAQIPSDWK